MIRCSECANLLPWRFGEKSFCSCSLHRTDNGTRVVWTKVPKRHPHWCPRYKEERDESFKNCMDLRMGVPVHPVGDAGEVRRLAGETD